MGDSVASALTIDRRAVFRTAALWLVFLAPFFYLTYGTANWLASLRADVPNLAFGWERHIPFIAWTILPYWTINAFYALSLFVNDTPEEVGRLARRYLTAQVVAVLCFVAFPLQAIFVRPETHGLPGFMFDVLGGFDKTVQPGAFAAYRAAHHHLGPLARPAARDRARHLACLVPADRPIGSDDLAAPRHRHPDRRAARPLHPLVVSGAAAVGIRRLPA